MWKTVNPFANYKMRFVIFSSALKMLSMHEETHQICFCTLNSLQLLDVVSDPWKNNYEIMQAGEQIIERLMLDDGMDETQASDLFFNSKTFTRLADETSGLCNQPWQEIYALLKKELE